MQRSLIEPGWIRWGFFAGGEIHSGIKVVDGASSYEVGDGSGIVCVVFVVTLYI